MSTDAERRRWWRNLGVVTCLLTALQCATTIVDLVVRLLRR